MILLPNDVKMIIDRLQRNGYEAYAVGGCIRDSLLGIEPKDYDICTSALPNKTVECFSDFKIAETGLKHGTVTVIVNGVGYEITTFRKDGKYTDYRHPDGVSFTSSICEDLRRRDFTVNAIAYNDNSGLIDPFDGLLDIEKHIIRAVGNSEERFNEDGLRILRCLRFASVYGFEIDEYTAMSAHMLKDNLSYVSVERIKSELDKLICGNECTRIMRDFSDVLSVFIPEIRTIIGYDQHTPYHYYDLWEHTLHTIDNIDPDLTLRYTMLFHDLGKPDVRTTDSNGQCHYKKHASAGVKIAEQILKRLKFEKRMSEDILYLISSHMDDPPQDRVSTRKFICRHGIKKAGMLLKVMLADNLSKMPPNVVDERAEKIKKTCETYNDILRKGDCCLISDLAVSGDDLISIGVPSGRRVGEILTELLKAVIEGKTENNNRSLIEYAQKNIKFRKKE